MKQEKFGAPIGNQNAKGGDSNGGDIEKEVSETRATLKNKIKDVAPGGKWNEAGTVYTVKMQPNKNDRWDAPEALNKLDGLTGYAGASWDDNGNVTISTRTDDWIKRSIEVKKGYAKANKQEKLERVKSFAEAGRKIFGAPLGNKNAAGGGSGGESGDKTYDDRAESSEKIHIQSKMLNETGSWQKDGSKTYVASTDSPNLNGGQRHFVDIQNEDKGLQSKHVQAATEKMNEFQKELQNKYPGIKTYVARTDSDNLKGGMRVFIDVAKPD